MLSPIEPRHTSSLVSVTVEGYYKAEYHSPLTAAIRLCSPPMALPTTLVCDTCGVAKPATPEHYSKRILSKVVFHKASPDSPTRTTWWNCLLCNQAAAPAPPQCSVCKDQNLSQAQRQKPAAVRRCQRCIDLQLLPPGAPGALSHADSAD